MLILSPAVQNFWASKFTEYLKENYDVDVHVEKIFITPLGKVQMQNVLALDHHGDTLFYVRQLLTGIKRPKAFLKNQFLFDQTQMSDARIKLITYEGEKNDNFSIFIEKLDKSSGPRDPDTPPFVLNIPETTLDNVNFSLYNYNVKKESLYDLHRINGQLENFNIHGPDLTVDIKNWKFTDKYHLQVERFSNRFLYTRDSIRIDRLLWKTAQSSIQGNIQFYYTRQQLRHFFDSVRVAGTLEIQMHSKDLNLLADSLFGKDVRVRLKSDLSGVINRLNLNRFRLVAPGENKMNGHAVLFQLTDLKKFGLSLPAFRSDVSYTGLKTLLPLVAERLPEEIENLKKLSIEGDLEYFPERLSFNGNIQNEQTYADGALSIVGLNTVPVYDLQVNIAKLPLDVLLKNNEWGNLSGEVKMKGKDFSPEQARGKIEAVLKELEFRQYAYKKIHSVITFDKGIVRSTTRVKDPNFQMAAGGEMNIGNRRDYKLNLQLTSADLYRTHWVKHDTLAHLKGSLLADIQGDNPDDWTGRLFFKNIRYVTSSNVYQTDSIEIRSEKKDSLKHLVFTSDRVVNGYVKGFFSWKNLPSMMKKAMNTVFYLHRDIQTPENEFLGFNLRFDKNFLQLLMPELRYTNQTLVKGMIDMRENAVHVEFDSKELEFDNFHVYHSKLIVDNQNPIFNLFVKADSLLIGTYPVQNLQAIHLKIRDTIFLKTKFTGSRVRKDTFDLAMKYTLDSMQNIHGQMMPGKMVVRNSIWKFDPAQYANRWDYFVKNDSLTLRDITLFNGEQYVKLNGYNTPDKRDIIWQFKNLILEQLYAGFDPFLWKGVMNGQLKMGKVSKIPFYNADLNINGFELNNTYLGFLNIAAKSVNNEVVFLDIFNRNNEFKNNIKAMGYLDFSKRNLDVNVTVSDFPLKMFNPVLQDIFNDIRGTATGHINISGPMNNPQYNGSLFMNGAGLGINVLKTDYAFQNQTEVMLQGQKFVFNNTSFFDTEYQTQGTLDGYISFYNFENWFVDLNINADKLLVLNTPPDLESLYYGTAFVSGEASIKGFVNGIKIDADVKSEQGSKIYIPLRDVETIGEDDFIVFHDKKDFKKISRPKLKKVYEGLELNLDIDVTQDAEVEIVVDPEFGSKLITRGEGTLLLEIQTEGKFQMWGSYQVLSGNYFFRYLGVIDKKFDVEPGSLIVWNGDPYSADLDIKAMYHIPAVDVSPLLGDANIQNYRVPMNVLIYLKGNLMKPRIEFDIEVPEANAMVRSQIEYLFSDPDKKMLQILALLYAGTFISEDNLNIGSVAAVGGNISERLLNVFNTLLENEKFNVKLNYVPGTENPVTNVKTNTEVGLTIETKISKRIYINGKVAVPVGRYTNQSVSGDVEVQIWITPKGELQMRIFNKRTEIIYSEQEPGYTRGIGISYHVEFDTFKELARKFGFIIEEEKEK